MTHTIKQHLIKQRYLMIKKHQSGMKVTEICRQHDISRKTFYKWLTRYKRHGKEGLLDLPRTPKSPHPKSLRPKVVKAIIRLRKKTRYGPKRLKRELVKRRIRVSEYAIYMTLVRHDLIPKRRKRRKKPQKYYAPSPGYRVQVDTKYLDLLPGYPHRFYQYTATDAYSRLRCLRVYEERSASNAVDFLRKVVRVFPFKVEAVCTDNGTEFTYGPFQKDHPFSLECARHRIRHILNRPGHPEANGRCERSHRTDDEEFYRVTPVKNPREWKHKIRRWEREYNYHRPHMALNDLTPHQAWLKYRQEEKEKEKESTKEKERENVYVT